MSKRNFPFRVYIDNILLSEREVECIYWLTKYMTAKQIARQLNLSYRTVQFYIEKIRDKLNCDSWRDVVIKALKSKTFPLKELARFIEP
jgi:DNA-binding CsgD family transcriptional regulator